MPIHTELKKLIVTLKWKNNISNLSQTYSSHTTNFYYNILNSLPGKVNLWKTNYYHLMDSLQDIVKWYSSSGLRPYLDCLTDDDVKTEFISEYEDTLKDAYSLQADNKILFLFMRILITMDKIE